MKQARITIAYNTLIKLYRTPGIPFPVSCQLFMMKKNLQPFYDLQAEKQEAIIEAHGQGDSGELTAEIRKEFAEIVTAEVDYDKPPVDIHVNDALAEKLGITGETIDQLDGFINFIYEG